MTLKIVADVHWRYILYSENEKSWTNKKKCCNDNDEDDDDDGSKGVTTLPCTFDYCNCIVLKCMRLTNALCDLFMLFVAVFSRDDNKRGI